jgi:hypothetical protein
MRTHQPTHLGSTRRAAAGGYHERQISPLALLEDVRLVPIARAPRGALVTECDACGGEGACDAPWGDLASVTACAECAGAGVLAVVCGGCGGPTTDLGWCAGCDPRAGITRAWGACPERRTA